MTIEHILRSLKIMSRGLALFWCSLRRNIITGNNILWPYHVFIICSLHLFCMYCMMVVKSVGLLTSSKSLESPHRQRVGTCVFAAEQLAVLCYWLVGYVFTFLIGCRFWVCFFFSFTRVDAGQAFWRLTVSSRRSARRCVVANGAMLWDTVAAECCDICRGCSR